MSFLEKTANFLIKIPQGIRTLLNAISSRLVPGFLEKPLANMRQKFPLPYRIGKGALWLSVFSTIALGVFFTMVYMGFFGKIPDYYQLKNIKKAQSSEIYGIDNRIIGKYYLENRTNVTYDEISKHVIFGLVATEDKRFFEHGGIDVWSWLRVIVKSVLLGDRSSGGGSTISQQLAKNLFGREHRYGKFSILVSKTKEFILAQRLEKIYSKDEILTAYLNTVSFGEDTYGIENASILFYNKKPKDVTIDEAAVLVGTLKAPTTYNPHNHPGAALGRRNTVLKRMQELKYIKPIQYDTLSRKLLKLNYNPNTKNTGVAPYFREKLRVQLEKEVESIKKPDGNAYDLYTDGLKIYTTIDSRMQSYAEDAVKLHMGVLQRAFDKMYSKTKPWGKGNNMLTQEMRASNRYEAMKADGATDAEIEATFRKPVKMKIFTYDAPNNEKEVMLSPWDSVVYYHSLLSCGFLAMDPRNGHVRAWVGGVDFKHRQYDHVTAKRQVGSTFKPIVYAAALEQGALPCDYFPNEVRTYADYENWRPENSENLYGGFYSMKGALTKSLNTITVQLMMQAGIDNVINLANRMGISSDLPQKPAIALGAGDISLKEMVTAYGVFANMGIRRDPIYLLRIEDKNGKILKSYTAETPQGEQVLSDSICQFTVEMMRGVINNGTGQRLRSTYGLRNDIAGKTGTTQNQTDGWFIGFTPNLVAGAWVGGDDPSVRFKSLALGQGANTSLPIFGSFLQKVYADGSLFNYRPNAAFPVPSDTVRAFMDCADFSETNVVVAPVLPDTPVVPEDSTKKDAPDALKPAEK
jgi:penicillin-binding protein 1A